MHSCHNISPRGLVNVQMTGCERYIISLRNWNTNRWNHVGNRTEGRSPRAGARATKMMMPSTGIRRRVAQAQALDSRRHTSELLPSVREPSFFSSSGTTSSIGCDVTATKCSAATRRAATTVCRADMQKEYSAFDRVSVLSEALPYLQKFRGKTIVIKYGGAAMKDESLKAHVVTDLVLLATVGIRPVLVHGGGPEINIWLSKLGIEAQFKNGLRVTDGDTMDVVEMVLGARVNKSLVNLIQQAGGQAVGICGKDSDTILARQMIEKDIGFVGEVTSVDPRLIEGLASQGYIPVVASVASDGKGQALNVNADTAAGEIAASLRAEKLILMTDVAGVLHDKDDPASIYPELTIRDCNQLKNDGILAGGMIPKVECCIRSLSQGVSATHIIDGRQPHSLLMELLTDGGVGTMITG